MSLSKFLPERFNKFLFMKKSFTISEFFKLVLSSEQFDTYMEIYNQNVTADVNPNDSFPVDFDFLVDKMGYSRKDSAKRTLRSFLIENEHYQISYPDGVHINVDPTQDEKSIDSSGRKGFNEIINLSYEGSQLFCLKAKTNKSMEYAMTFTAILKAITDYHQLSAFIDPLLSRHNELAIRFRNQKVVYLAWVIDQCNKLLLVKVGESDDVFDRKDSLQAEYGCIYLLEIFPVSKPHEIEQDILKLPDVKKRIYMDQILGKNHTEVIQLDDVFTYDILLRLVKNYVTHFNNNDNTLNRLREKSMEIEHLKLQLLKDNPNLVNDLKEMDLSRIPEPELESKEFGTSFIADKRKKRTNSNYFIQRIDPKDLTIVLSVYESEMDVTREIEGASRSRIISAIKGCHLYMNSRWIKVDADKDKNTSHCNTETVVTSTVPKSGLVAKITKDGSVIKMVFNNQREAMKEAQLSSPGSISVAIKKGTLSCKHLYKMWDDCSQELKDAYVLKHGTPEIIPENGNSIAINQIDPITQRIIKRYTSIEQIVKEFAVGRVTLNNAIASRDILRNFIWEKDV
jgi:hypothetical protein